MAKKICACLFFLVIFIFSASAVEVFLPGFSWHDQQRVAEFLLIIIAAVLFVGIKEFFVDRVAVFLLGAFFLLGLLSCFFSEYPLWALREWARYVGLIVLSFVVAFFSTEACFKVKIFFVFLFCSFVFVMMFFLYYISAVFGAGRIDSFLMVYGFDNPRFLGQFQVLLIPILTAAGYDFWVSKKRVCSFFVFLIVFLHWVVVWSVVSRGVVISLFLVWIFILFLNFRFFNFGVLFFTFPLFGLLFSVFLFSFLPGYLGGEYFIREIARVGLSKREVLWWSAWGDFVNNPWLGIGPLHFSAVWNHVAAHPHQFVLQTLAEWGGIAAGIIFYLIARGFFRVAVSLRSSEFSYLDCGLFAALLGVLFLAQVDGVLVMPYPAVWVAILVGVVIERWGRGARYGARFELCFKFFVIAALFLIIFQVAHDVPDLQERQIRFNESEQIGSPPRMWSQGWIPM